MRTTKKMTKMVPTKTRKTRWSRNTAACLAMGALLALLPSSLATSQEKPKEKQKKEKPYALIFGTAYGPNDRPLYGVKVTIRPEKKKKPSWDLMSDHRGEFAERVRAGASDYSVRGEA